MTDKAEILRAIKKALDAAILLANDSGGDQARYRAAKEWAESELGVPRRKRVFTNASVPTFAHVRWLERLEEEGPLRQSERKRPLDCYALGWTEPDMRLHDGAPITEGHAIARFGENWFRHVKIYERDRITDAGRMVLAKIRADKETTLFQG